MERALAEIETKEEDLKLQTAIQCVKALSLLSSLKSIKNRHFNTVTRDEDEEPEREMLMRSIEDLKIQLLRERLENRKMRFCSLIEFLLLILVLFSLLGVTLFLAFGFA